MSRLGLFALILMVLGLAGLAAAMGGRWERFSPSWYTSASRTRSILADPDRVRRAVYAESQVWAVAGGEVWAIDPAAARASRTGLAAQDICVHEGELALAVASVDKPGRWIVKKRRAGAWVSLVEVDGGGDGLVGLDCGSEIRLLFASRLLTVGRGTPTIVLLSNRIPALPPNVLQSTSEHLLVGLNAGEWGGALMRIDQRTGRVEELGDPRQINAIAPHPSRPECKLASSVDFAGASGVLLEICGERVREIASHRRPGAPNDAGFYGLANLDSGVTVSTVDGLYRVLEAGRLSAVEKPSFAQAGPFQVSVGPDYILLRAPVDERFHPGGANSVIIIRALSGGEEVSLALTGSVRSETPQLTLAEGDAGSAARQVEE